jgi:3-methylcrotonyl-CoA carboxylase alpha subunit
MRSDWKDGDRGRTVEIAADGGGRYRVTVDGNELAITVERLAGDRLRLVTADGATTAEVTAVGSRRFVRLGAMDFVIERALRSARGSASADHGLEAPMPGIVARVMVAAGDRVTKGQPLVAVEAMKMEHLVRAPRDGRVKSVRIAAGEMVAGGVPLVELDPADVPPVPRPGCQAIPPRFWEFACVGGGECRYSVRLLVVSWM